MPGKTKWTEPELAMVGKHVTDTNIKLMARGRGAIERAQHIYDPKTDRRYIYRVDPGTGEVIGGHEVVQNEQGGPPLFAPLQKSAQLLHGDAAKATMGSGQRFNPSKVDMPNLVYGQKSKFQFKVQDPAYKPEMPEMKRMSYERALGKWNWQEAIKGGVGAAKRLRSVLTKKRQEQQL